MTDLTHLDDAPLGAATPLPSPAPAARTRTHLGPAPKAKLALPWEAVTEMVDLTTGEITRAVEPQPAPVIVEDFLPADAPAAAPSMFGIPDNGLAVTVGPHQGLPREPLPGAPPDAPDAPLPLDLSTVDVPAVLRGPWAYLCGPAGTGKTTMARAMVDQLPGAVLAATTGIAAVNLGEGTTINALLRYFDTENLTENYVGGFLVAHLGRLFRSGVRRILLDEVSMLDADQLTVMTKALEELGGKGYVVGDPEIQEEIEEAQAKGEIGPVPIALTLIGDFAQLPPVKAPFAFESTEWPRYGDARHTLTKIWRQADAAFIEALQAARRGEPDGVVEFFRPRLSPQSVQAFDGTTILATNDAVARFNALRMAKLTTPPVSFPVTRWGTQRGDWKQIPEAVELKVGALVMILANHRERPDEDGNPGRLIYANGDLGTVTHLDPGVRAGAGVAIIRLERTGEEVEVDYIVRANEIPLEPGRKKELRQHGLEHLLTIDGKREIIGTVEYLPVRVAYATTVHKCVSVETRVRVRDRLVRIADVATGDFLHVGGEVLTVAKTVQHAYRVTTARGYSVIASADHRWLTATGWVSTTELSPALGRVRIALNPGQPVRGLSDEYAWWLGMTVGDGNYTHRREGQIHLACLDQALGNAWASAAQNLGAPRVSWRRDKRGLHLTCRAFRDALAVDGLGYVKGPEKYVPRVVWERGIAAWQSFLRGLFDADGSVGKSFVVLTTASKRLGEETQELLLACGVVSTRRQYPGARDPYWQVRVDAEGLPAFGAIGFSQRTKAAKLVTLTPNRIMRPSGGFDPVVAVEDLGMTLPMIDLEVAAPHVIGTGPFRSHNSQGLSLDQVQVNIREHFFKTPGMLYVALSRARTADGLRLVGTVDGLRQRCTVHPKVKPWV